MDLRIKDVKPGRPVSIFILCLMLCVFLSSCGVPDEVKQDAKDKVTKYAPAFKQRVEEAYGKEAALMDPECKIDRTGSSPVPGMIYKTRPYLSGKIKLGGRKYDAIYLYDKDTVYDTVHTEDICNEIIGLLPVDKSQFYGTKILDPDFDHTKFKSDVDCLDKASVADPVYGALRIYIITTEDLSDLKSYDLEHIPGLEKISENPGFDCSITIVSCKNKNRISLLMGAVQDIQFYSSVHPEMITGSGSAEDVFEYYGIRCVVRFNYAYGANEAFYVE